MGRENVNLMSEETQHELIELRKNLQDKIEEVLEGQPVENVNPCYDPRTIILSSLVSVLRRIKNKNLIRDGAKSLQVGTSYKTGIIYTVDGYVFEVKKIDDSSGKTRYFGEIKWSLGDSIARFEIDTKK